MIATGRAAVVLAASWDPSIIWNGVYLAGALARPWRAAIEIFRRTMRGQRNDRLSASDQLAQYRLLYEQGAISEEEFNSLRSLLGGELRRSARKPAPATEATPPAFDPAADSKDDAPAGSPAGKRHPAQPPGSAAAAGDRHQASLTPPGECPCRRFRRHVKSRTRDTNHTTTRHRRNGIAHANVPDPHKILVPAFVLAVCFPKSSL